MVHKDPLMPFLKDRLAQLRDRKMMIPRYLDRPGSFVGRKDFSNDDLPVIEQQIKECEIAIKAIEEFRKNQKINAKSIGISSKVQVIGSVPPES